MTRHAPSGMGTSTRNSTRTPPRAGNPTLDDATVHVASADTFTSSAAIVAALAEQETRSALDEENCCASGNKGFRTYKTGLPVIRRQDITPGRLIYRPTTNPLAAYEILSEPYTNEHQSDRVDVRVHERLHAGDDAEIRTRETTLFTAMIVDEMTFLQPESVQETLPGVERDS